MTLSAPNSAHNIAVSDARAFVGKLAKLGFVLGDLHVNQQSGGGAEQADYVPLVELEAGIESGTKVCIVAFYGDDWHNVALLKQAFGAGGSEGLATVAARLGKHNRDAVLMNVPGALKAIDKLIEKA